MRAVRLTPAYAGNTEIFAGDADKHRAHPRIRGEYDLYGRQHGNQPGSPPHTRGIHVQDVYLLVDPGLTPAYAGNTL